MMGNDSPNRTENGSSVATGPETKESPPVRPDVPAPNPQFVKWFRDSSIPIAGVLLLSLTLCFIIRRSSISIKLATAKDVADMLKNIVEVIAIFVGGLWAFFRFRKGRDFEESLILSVSGKIVIIENQTYVVVNTHIKNVGHSKIKFSIGASTLYVKEYLKSAITDVITVPDKTVTQFDPLHEKDLYIEPNEIIHGTRFIAIPTTPDLGFRLEFEVISAKNSYTWRTACIVEKPVPSGNISWDESLISGGCI